MHFKFLAEIGAEYSAEEGSPGERRNALRVLESRLQAAHTKLEDLLQPAAPAPAAPVPAAPKLGLSRSGGAYGGYAGASGGYGGYSAGAGGYGGYASVPAAPAVKLKGSVEDIAKARAEVARYTRWLELQGASVNGRNVDWSLDNYRVVYDRDVAAQEQTRIWYGGGLLYTDKACQKPLDTKDMVTHFSGPGFAIYVMSEEGNIHVSSHAVGHRHHSSLLAGGRVACGGELQATEGRLAVLTNKSGHYKPSLPHFIQTLHLLQKKNVDMSGTRIRVFSAAGGNGRTYPNLADFLATLSPEQDYYVAKLNQYIAAIGLDEFRRIIGGYGYSYNGGKITDSRGVETLPKVITHLLKNNANVKAAIKVWKGGREK